jgi:hypothetical protein
MCLILSCSNTILLFPDTILSKIKTNLIKNNIFDGSVEKFFNMYFPNWQTIEIALLIFLLH